MNVNNHKCPECGEHNKKFEIVEENEDCVIFECYTCGTISILKYCENCKEFVFVNIPNNVETYEYCCGKCNNKI
ncbi:TPA: hypothetical protein SOL83_000729 [Clostridioides difficile]|nr:hypothetical protein [Clostridioides difficile]